MSNLGGLRQSQSVLHTWSGLVVGWVLFLIFIAGTAAYWKVELTRWMQPEVGLPADAQTAVAQAQQFLAHTAPDAQRWSIELPGQRSSATTVSWQPQGAPERRRGQRNPYQATLDANGTPVPVRETRGGTFFYRLHFDLHYVPVLWARWFISACSMFMLVAIISGVITHKKIFTDFFTLRRGKGQRTWLDGHNALAVLSLPFHLMITYTGLITLMTLYMPWAVDANYPGGRDAFFAELFPRAAKVEPSGVAATPPALAAVLRRAELQWGDGHAGSLLVEQPADTAMRISVRRQAGDRIADADDTLTFNARGELLDTAPARSAAVITRDGMIGLHAARFAPTTMRWLFFLSGVAGTLMVATGLVLWTVKRRTQLPDPQRPHLGFRVVERLNIGFVAGLPVAMLAFLWGNRLLPLDVGNRSDAEVKVFFYAWAACVLHAMLRAPRRGWVEQLAVAAVLALALPLYNLVAWHGGLFAALAAGDGAKAGIDIGLLLLGTGFAWAARKVHRFVPAQRRARAGSTAATTGASA
ncbi:PepSY-associated TM helix domain-containing protein [Stenotrophomonas sp. 24(2023)]|uniref:PepSY-associated TM helix domain-containing protein n=1 Tax=Stenotrophomonas sp. 24(2023) TaxID=3068324 RepID=UPI0027E1F19F|nr:PepSY-associated TM helix domain-containing protein [Stenotrophomonas sp. 24(2023)]WMJ68419.1 PepSY-associated TM helix domain-containing protein [Stenotrophomonas sp. 24(2023)]